MSEDDGPQRSDRDSSQSTGPRTQRGKGVSRMNALRLGATARSLLLPGEDPEDLADLEKGLRAALNPVGAAEQIMVERIVAAEVRRRRVEAAERSVLMRELAQRNVQRARRAGEKIELVAGAALLLLGDAAGNFEERGLTGYREALEAEQEAADVRDGEESDLGTVYAEAGDELDRLARHRTSAERSIDRALAVLGELQEMRAGSPSSPSTVIDITDSTTQEER